MSPTPSGSEPRCCCPHLSIMSNSRNDTAIHYHKVRSNKIHPPFSSFNIPFRAWIENEKPILERLVAENTAQPTPYSRKAVRNAELYRSERDAPLKRKVSLHETCFVPFLVHDNFCRKFREDSISRAKARIVWSPEIIRKAISIMSTSTIEDTSRRTISWTLSGSKHGPAVRVYQIRGTILRCILEESTRTLWRPCNPTE